MSFSNEYRNIPIKYFWIHASAMVRQVTLLPHDLLQQPADFWPYISAGPFLFAYSVFWPPNLPANAYFFRSSAVIEFYRLINALVISRKDSSTPDPNLALVFITFRLCVCSN